MNAAGLLSGGWADAAVALLLIGSGLLSLTAAIGLVRLRDFFQRMHPPALAATLGTWLAAAATTIHFSTIDAAPALYAWLLPILLAITVPAAMILLGRAALFRAREQRPDDVPPSLSERR
ncbi:MAG: Na+/H+ antiporter subunit G [Lautropia sp.]